jgi:hypothetical protein
MDEEADRLTLARYLMTARPEQLTAPAPAPGMSHAADTSHYDQMSDAGREGLNYMMLGYPASHQRGETVGQYLMDSGRGAIGGALLPFSDFMPASSAVEVEDMAAANPYMALPASFLGVGPVLKGMQAVGRLGKASKIGLGAGGIMLTDAQHMAHGGE